MENLVVSTAVYDKVFDNGECSRTPRLDDDCLAILELTHINLAGSNALLRTVSMTVDVQRTHTADTLAAIVVECNRLLAFVYEVVVENVQHFEERCIGRNVLNLVLFELSL